MTPEEIKNLPLGEVVKYVKAKAQAALNDTDGKSVELACSITKGTNELLILNDIQSALMEITKDDFEALVKGE